MPSAFINHNGKLLPADSPIAGAASRALRYGYGLFETMLLENGLLPLAKLHWARLFSGIETLRLEKPALWSGDLLEAEILRTAKRAGLDQTARVRLQVSPGEGGYYDREGWQPQFFIECFPLPEEQRQLNENGLVAGIASGIAKSLDALAGLKTCSALPYALAARQAVAARWNEAFVLNTAGRIADSTIANVFWLSRGVLHTPPLSEGCVAGVMRRHLIERVLPGSGVPFSEKVLTAEDLFSAEEVFLTNAVRKLRWVSRCGTAEYGNSLARRLFAML